jgi:hypothetical protein
MRSQKNGHVRLAAAAFGDAENQFDELVIRGPDQDIVQGEKGECDGQAGPLVAIDERAIHEVEEIRSRFVVRRRVQLARLHRRRSHTIVKATKTAVTTATHSGGIPIAISITAQALKNKTLPTKDNAIAIGDRGSFELLLDTFVNPNSYSPHRGAQH